MFGLLSILNSMLQWLLQFYPQSFGRHNIHCALHSIPVNNAYMYLFLLYLMYSVTRSPYSQYDVKTVEPLAIFKLQLRLLSTVTKTMHDPL